MRSGSQLFVHLNFALKFTVFSTFVLDKRHTFSHFSHDSMTGMNLGFLVVTASPLSLKWQSDLMSLTLSRPMTRWSENKLSLAQFRSPFVLNGLWLHSNPWGRRDLTWIVLSSCLSPWPLSTFIFIFQFKKLISWAYVGLWVDKLLVHAVDPLGWLKKVIGRVTHTPWPAMVTSCGVANKILCVCSWWIRQLFTWYPVVVTIGLVAIQVGNKSRGW